MTVEVHGARCHLRSHSSTDSVQGGVIGILDLEPDADGPSAGCTVRQELAVDGPTLCETIPWRELGGCRLQIAILEVVEREIEAALWRIRGRAGACHCVGAAPIIGLVAFVHHVLGVGGCANDAAAAAVSARQRL